MKYEAKLKNMSEILSQLSTDKLPLGPTIIGMSEVENRRVLEDLLKQPALSDRGYEIVHYEGPDRRGVVYLSIEPSGFKFFLKTSKYRYCILYTRFVYYNWLEPSFKGLVFFYILSIFVKCSCSYTI